MRLNLGNYSNRKHLPRLGTYCLGILPRLGTYCLGILPRLKPLFHCRLTYNSVAIGIDKSST